MTEERKLQIPVEVDATGAKQGFSEVKAAAQDMAQAVGQAGAAAGKGIDGIGAGAPATTQKLDAASRSIIGSIQRTTAVMEAGGKTSAKYFEVLAQQRGVSPELLKPYLEQLRQVEAAQKAATAAQAASAGVTGAATKQLNAYGQSAAQTAQALRQVPAQITDIITSLASGQAPLTVLIQQGGQLKDTFGGIAPAARALGGAVLAMINPVTLAGAAVVGLALAYESGAKESRAYTSALILSGNAAGTTSSQLQGYAANIAKVAGTQSQAAAALAEFARAGRVGASGLEDFARAALVFEKATGQAVSKTAEQFADLGREPVTASIKLNEQMNYLTADIYKQIKALDEQGRTTEAANVAQRAFADTIERRSSSVLENLGYIERAWNAIKGAITGAGSALANIGRQNTIGDQITAMQGLLTNAEALKQAARRRGQNVPDVDSPEVKGIKDSINFLQEQERMMRRGADAAADRARLTKLAVDFEQRGDQFKQKAAKRDEEIARERVTGQELINAGLLTEQQLQGRIADIREKYKEKGADRNDSSELANLRARVQTEQTFLEQLKARGLQADKLNEGEKLVLQLQEQLKGKLDARTRSATELQLIEAKRLAGIGKEVQSLRDRAKLEEELATQQAKTLGNAYTAADATEDLADKQENANRVFGQGKAALLDLTIAQLEKTKADLEATDNVIPGYIDAINKQIEATKRLRGAQAEGEGLEAAKKAADEIEKEWKRTTESISDSLTDALLRGFESGKGFAENFRDTLKNMFSTLVLRPLVQGIVAPVSGAASSFTQSLVGGSPLKGLVPGGGGGLGNLSSLVNTGANLFSPGSGALGAVGSAFGIGGGAATVSGAATSGAALEAALGASGTFATAGGTAAGALGAVGAAAPYLAAAVAVYSLLNKKKGGAKVEGSAGTIDYQGAELDGLLKQRVDSVTAQYDSLVSSFGGKAGTAQFGFGLSMDPKGDSQNIIGREARVNGRQVYFGNTEDGGRGEEAGNAALDRVAKEALVAALRAADLPGALGELLRSQTQNSVALADRIGKIAVERESLNARLYLLTSTDLEKLNRTREAERAAIDETNRALLNQVYATEDLRVAEANLLTAYGNEASQLNATIDAHRAYARELRQFRDGLLLGDKSPLSSARKLPLAGQQFSTTLARAATGDAAARSGVTSAADDYLSAALAGATSRTQYDLIFAEVSAGLTTAAAGAESQATIAEQQLSTMQGQLSALNLLNNNLQSFAQAWAAHNSAQVALEQAKAAVAASNAVYTPPAPAPGPATPTAPSTEGWGSYFWSGGGDGGYEWVAGNLGGYMPGPAPMQQPEQYAGNQFATGGAFTNGIVTRPTSFNMGVMGEAGPEAIMPLTNVGGRLGVRAMGGGELAGLMREVLAEMKQARSEGRMEAAASVTQLGKLTNMVKKWDAVGTPPVREEVSA